MYDNFELCLHQVRVILTNVAEYGKASYVIHQNPLKDKGLTSDKEWFSTKAHWECIAKGHLSKYILKKQRDYYVLTPEGQKLYNKLGPVDLKDPDTYKKTYFFTKGKNLQYQIDQIKECFKLAEAYI
ncbi:MAG: hypothetical protein KatS3mg129_1141 [Leptospiraceae bacterium]|nr:MAG: hypothetical protein KatS3mg129_1141 [Leptospiraceae bacterium]